MEGVGTDGDADGVTVREGDTECDADTDCDAAVCSSAAARASSAKHNDGAPMPDVRLCARRGQDRGWGWVCVCGCGGVEEIFEPIGFANDYDGSIDIDCMDMDAFPEWEDIKEPMNGAFECEEEYESFKTAFRYFHDADISLKLLLIY